MTSLFNKIRTTMRTVGHTIDGVAHMGEPMLNAGGTAFITDSCPLCTGNGAIVFNSSMDKSIQIIACIRNGCGKVSHKYDDGRVHHPLMDVPTCGCKQPLPKGRKKFCYTCRPRSNKVPKEVVSQTTAVY